MSIITRIFSIVRSAIGLPRILSGGVRKTLIRLITPSSVRQGMHYKHMIKDFNKVFAKPTTLGERMDISRLSEREGLRQATAALSYDVRFPRSDMFETLFRKDRNYLFKVRVGLQHPVSGRYQDRWVTLFGNDNMSKEDIYKMLPEDLKERYHAEKYNIVDWNIEEIWHNKGNKY